MKEYEDDFGKISRRARIIVPSAPASLEEKNSEESCELYCLNVEKARNILAHLPNSGHLDIHHGIAPFRSKDIRSDNNHKAGSYDLGEGSPTSDLHPEG